MDAILVFSFLENLSELCSSIKHFENFEILRSPEPNKCKFTKHGIIFMVFIANWCFAANKVERKLFFFLRL